MSHKPDMLRMENVRVTYRGGYRAVDELSLRVGCDESVALVGESGCGKSTTLRAVLGLLPLRARLSGAIYLDEVPLHELGPRARSELQQQAGYVTQDPYSAYDPLRTVRHHVTEGLRANRLPVDESGIAERLNAAGVPQAVRRWRQYPHQWSGGMLQRADIIAATLRTPAITLADEPTSALDAELADDMIRLLRQQSKALLFVTHDLELAARHADRIIVMQHGRVIEEAAPAEIFENPKHQQTARFVESVRQRASPPEASAVPTGRVIASLAGVSKSYRIGRGEQVAVESADLQVRAGEVVGIYGVSGSGKSTLLRLLAGLEKPDTGTAQLVSGAGAVLPIFQDPVRSLDQRWPIWRSITEPLMAPSPGKTAEKPTRRARMERARETLSAVALEHIDPKTYPGALSVGQCQRVAIARVVCASPQLVIADEPTASLDITTSAEIGALLRQLRQRGSALVIVSHDVTFLRTVADRVLRMDHGRLAAAEGLADAAVESAAG